MEVGEEREGVEVEVEKGEVREEVEVEVEVVKEVEVECYGALYHKQPRKAGRQAKEGRPRKEGQGRKEGRPRKERRKATDGGPRREGQGGRALSPCRGTGSTWPIQCVSGTRVRVLGC